jgi:integrase
LRPLSARGVSPFRQLRGPRRPDPLSARKGLAAVAKKRANGEGSIYQRKDGRWVGQYTVEIPGGRNRREYVYAGTREEARVKLTKAIADRDGGLVYDAGKLTLGEHVDRWLRHSKKDSVKPITYESYSSLARNHIVPALGRIRLKDLTPDRVRAFRTSKLEAGLSRRTVQYLLTLLRQALGQAVEDGLLPRNPAQGVSVKRIGDGEEIPHLAPQQAKALLAAAREERLWALYVLAVHTGLRQGELLALRWADVDLAAGKLSVRRTLSAAKDGPRFTSPKTRKSRRSVGLTGAAVDALVRHRAAQEEERARLGNLWEDGGGGDDLVFRSTTGTPLNRHNLARRSFKPLLGKAGLPDVPFHALRHTAASLLFSRGTHPKMVSEILGHSDVSVTLDTYSHMIPGMHERAVADMEDALS